MFITWFFHRCRIFIHMNRNIVNIHKFIQKKGNEHYIIFRSRGYSYICENKNDYITFNLRNFLLKKSFIRAFVIRQIRYKTISNKLKISKLFSIRLKCEYDKFFLVIDNHRYLIVNNGISKNTIFSSEISKANFGAMYMSRLTFVSNNNIEEINEKLYLDKYVFYKERKYGKK